MCVVVVWWVVVRLCFSDVTCFVSSLCDVRFVVFDAVTLVSRVSFLCCVCYVLCVLGWCVVFEMLVTFRCVYFGLSCVCVVLFWVMCRYVVFGVGLVCCFGTCLCCVVSVWLLYVVLFICI